MSTGPATEVLRYTAISLASSGTTQQLAAHPGEAAQQLNADTDIIDVSGPDAKSLSVAGRDVATFADNRSVAVDTDDMAYPRGFASFAPGDYRVQAVLDRDGSYNRTGRGAGAPWTPTRWSQAPTRTRLSARRLRKP